jgi:hypothetical protein
MSTRRQRAASRTNGQKSQGPITAEGKAKSRFNALKHGIDAKHQVMFNESAEDLAELAAEYHELHAPANADERFLVDTMINYEWRLRRLRCVEADLWRATHNLFLEKNAAIGSADYGDAFTASGPAFERLQRIINSCERHYRDAKRDLAAARHARHTPQPEESTATSESPGSIRTSPETAAAAAPKLPPNPPKAANPTAALAEKPVERNMAPIASPPQADFAKC